MKSTLVSREFDPEAPPQHILDSLLPSEIRTVTEAIRGVVGDENEVLFSLMLLEEPSRESSIG
ncbi:MAG: hypothetical protein WAO93_04975, partial [Orrella sp.]